jgi:hypothetical protein
MPLIRNNLNYALISIKIIFIILTSYYSTFNEYFIYVFNYKDDGGYVTIGEKEKYFQ